MRMQLRMPSWAAVACFRTYARAEQRAAIDDVRLPVLQIVGEHDAVAPVAGARWLAERLADSRLVELAGCGHTPMLEDPEAFDAELHRFLIGERASSERE
jgi:pimeloyl-ACP methyl ester carboxylesterase